MTISNTTAVVVLANGLTAVISAALLMVVLWQAPRRRMNVLFALTMFLLMGYCVANIFGRFIAELGLDPAQTTYMAVTLFGYFTITMFVFASDFAHERTLTTEIMALGGMAAGVLYVAAMWSDRLIVNIHSTDDPGSYQGEWTTLGMTASTILMGYLAVSAVVIYRMKDPRAQVLWLAPVLALVGIISSVILWPLIHIPLQAMFLAASAFVLGRPVLRDQLFNPLAELHRQLGEKHAELSRASSMKSQFLTDMSHELRTPLNSIIGYTELVMGGMYGALNDTQQDRLEKVVRNGQTLLKLVNDAIDLNRIETGALTLEKRMIDVPGVLNTVLDTIEPLAVNKGLALRRDFGPLPAIYADEVRLRQIVTNLVANAIKFTHKGSVTVRASTANSLVRFEVTDTGIGIAPEQFETVFQEFKQIDESTTREYEGSGLGLTITRRLVELHGGTIWLESAVGQGSTFFVSLPISAAPPAAAPVPVSAAAL
jgi:signal transduction histidine kinase